MLCRKIKQENYEAFGFQGLHPLVFQILTGKFHPLLLNPSWNHVAKTILPGGKALGLEECLEFLENPGREVVGASVWSAPAAGLGGFARHHLWQPIFREQFKPGCEVSTHIPKLGYFNPIAFQLSPTQTQSVLIV